MRNPRLAVRYAKSLLALAVEQGKLEEVFHDMEWLQEAAKASKEFAMVLKSPVLKADVKVKLLEAVTAGKINDLTAAFNKLLLQKNRESNLVEIADAFKKLYYQHHQIQTVQLTTAQPADEATKQAVLAQLKAQGGFDKVNLETKVDPDIIGGFVLQAGDQLIDASVSYDLKQIARQFENNDFLYKIR